MDEEKKSPAAAVLDKGGDARYGCDGSEDCAILHRMRDLHEFSEDDLAHLECRPHPMTPCRYGADCRAFQRLSNRGDRLDDRCHVRLFAHPARDRYAAASVGLSNEFHRRDDLSHSPHAEVTRGELSEIAVAKLPEGFSPFVYRKSWDEESAVESKPDRSASQKLADWFRTVGRGLGDDEQLKALIAEVKRNGYGDDLVTADGDSLLLTVVDRKLAHPRCEAIQAKLAEKVKEWTEDGEFYSPLTRAHMLALILYTGCDANYAMCAAEREGDYKTWEWFSWLLQHALYRLGRGDTVEQPVAFSGIPKVRVTAKVGDEIWLATHTSTSEDLAVAEGFAKDEGGVILEFETSYADVSWISKFPSEKERLWLGGVEFKVKSIKIVDGRQRVVLW